MKFAINFKHFQHKQDRPCIVEPKREGMACNFEKKLFIKTCLNILKCFLKKTNKLKGKFLLLKK